MKTLLCSLIACPGQTVRADSTLNVAMQNESVTVRGERERGEVEALDFVSIARASDTQFVRGFASKISQTDHVQFV